MSKNTPIFCGFQSVIINFSAGFKVNIMARSNTAGYKLLKMSKFPNLTISGRSSLC